MPSAHGRAEDGDEQRQRVACRACSARPPRPRGRARRAARRPGASPRTHSGSTSTSSGLAAVIATRRRPGSRRTRGRVGLDRAAAPRSRRRPRSPRARRAARGLADRAREHAVGDEERVAEVRARARSRPRLGLSPTSPQQAAGMRIEPPPSLPWATGTIPAATAAAEPPRGAARRARAVPRVARGPGVARLGGRQDPELGHVRDADDDEAGLAQAPHEVGAVESGGGPRGTSSAKFMHSPSTGTLALIAIGTPANGRVSPGWISSAAASARSASTSMNAFRPASSAPIRSSARLRRARARQLAAADAGREVAGRREHEIAGGHGRVREPTRQNARVAFRPP